MESEQAMPPTFAITTLMGVVLVTIGIFWKNIGYPWHFTKEA